MQLYIARHGETEYNYLRRIQGSGVDTALTAKGVEQAQVLGKIVEGMEFDAVYSSPLGRAMNTTRIVFKDDDIFEKMALTDPRIVEIGMGEAEGLPWEQIDTRFMDDPINYIPPPGGETLPDMIERIDSFLQELAKKPYKKVFVLAHGYVMRVVYSCVMDKSVEAIGKAPIFDNCAMTLYVHDGDKWNYYG